MIPELRQAFNASFSQKRYDRFLERMDARVGMNIDFHISESPVFVPNSLARECERAAIDLTIQAHSPECLSRSAAALRPEYTVGNQSEHTLFMVVDFAITRDVDGRIVPKLIELQGFPSLYGFQLMEAEMIHEHFSLPPDLEYINGGHSRHGYLSVLRRAICAKQDPEQVVLLEFDPWNQKTCPDFLAMQELLDIGVADIRSVRKTGRTLHYERDGKLIPIRRIYNRAIVDELENERVRLPFDWHDDLDVEWAGHPNWYFRISKFLLPLLKHPTVPKSTFLSELAGIPENLEQYVLKPLYSFAGSGVIVGPDKTDIAAIPQEQHGDYLLQERVEYAGVLETPHGPTKVELRFMLVWLPDEPEPRAVMNLVRAGRGAMMGVRYNKDLPWTGSTGMFIAPE